MNTGGLVTDLMALVDDVMERYECDECAGSGLCTYGPTWRDDLEPERCKKCKRKGWVK
jgi:hypothetical protein